MFLLVILFIPIAIFVYWIAKSIFKNNPKKTLAATILVTCILTLGSVYLLLHTMDEHSDNQRRITECLLGYEGSIDSSKLFGKWQANDRFISLLNDNKFNEEFFDGRTINGDWRIKGSILFFDYYSSNGQQNNSNSNAIAMYYNTHSSFRICDYSSKKLIYRDLGNEQNQENLTLLKK